MNPASDPQQRVFRFGSCVVDAGRHEVHVDGQEVELQPKVFDLLLYLLIHHDRVVDKDELQDAVWPGLVITETSLTRAVMKARKAVGDDASRQAVIRTVHGRGYRFVAELLPAPATAEPAAQPGNHVVAEPPAPTGKKRSRKHFVWPAGLAVAALLVLAVVVSVLRPAAEAGSETRIAVLPLRNDTGDAELVWTRLGLMSYVSNLIETDGGLAVVQDGSVVSLADALDWQGGLDEVAGSDMAERLARAYGATHILAMQLEGQGGNLRMNYSLLDPEGGVKRGTMVGSEGTALAQGVVQSLYGNLLRRARSGDAIPDVSTDPFNNEAFARGMDLSLQGRCAEAVPFFRVIMDQEPTLFAPRFEYAACARVLGENDEAEALLDTLVAEQRPLGESRSLGLALMNLGVLYNRTGRLDEAEVAHREARQVAGAVGDHDLAGRVLQNLAIVSEDRGRFAEADELLDLAILEFRAGGREVLPGQLWSGRANLKMDVGELVEAKDYLDRAISAFREVGDLRNEAMMYNNTGYLLREMGRLQEAEGYHQRSLVMRQEIGDRVGVGRVYGQLSALYTAQGRYAEAAEAAAAAREVAADTRDRLYEGTSLAQWAAAEAGLGDHEAAREHYTRSRQVFADIQDQMRVLQVDVALASLSLASGDAGAAQALASAVVEEAGAAGLIQPEVEAMELLGEVALAQGDAQLAIDLFAAALSRVRETSWGGKEAELLVHLLNAHLDSGDAAAAAPLAGALAGLEPGIGSLTAQARYARETGDTTRAVALLGDAKLLAGERWDADSEALLAEYQTGQ